MFDKLKKEQEKETDEQMGELNNPIVRNTKIKKLNKKITLVALVIVLFLAGYYFYNYSYKNKKQNLNTTNTAIQKEAEDLVLVVGKLVELPKDEIPTVVTILDKEKLKDQPFFKTAENGDKLLAYTKALKAILYRPSTNKIIDITPLTLSKNNDSGQDVKQNSVVSASDVKVVYYNGTLIAGLARSMEKIVREKFTNFKTVALLNASKTTYKETVVVNISGKHNKETIEVAKLLNGKVGLMPDGEVKPLADILIISGK